LHRLRRSARLDVLGGRGLCLNRRPLFAQPAKPPGADLPVTGPGTGTRAATQPPVGRYTNPEDRRNTLPISMDYVPSSYERPSSLTTVRGSYQSAGTYFGNSWWLRIESTTDTTVNRLVGAFNDGCAISGELTAPDLTRG